MRMPDWDKMPSNSLSSECYFCHVPLEVGQGRGEVGYLFGSGLPSRMDYVVCKPCHEAFNAYWTEHDVARTEEKSG